MHTCVYLHACIYVCEHAHTVILFQTFPCPSCTLKELKLGEAVPQEHAVGYNCPSTAFLPSHRLARSQQKTESSTQAHTSNIANTSHELMHTCHTSRLRMRAEHTAPPQHNFLVEFPAEAAAHTLRATHAHTHTPTHAHARTHHDCFHSLHFPPPWQCFTCPRFEFLRTTHIRNTHTRIRRGSTQLKLGQRCAPAGAAPGLLDMKLSCNEWCCMELHACQRSEALNSPLLPSKLPRAHAGNPTTAVRPVPSHTVTYEGSPAVCARTRSCVEMRTRTQTPQRFTALKSPRVRTRTQVRSLSRAVQEPTAIAHLWSQRNQPRLSSYYDSRTCHTQHHHHTGPMTPCNSLHPPLCAHHL